MDISNETGDDSNEDIIDDSTNTVVIWHDVLSLFRIGRDSKPPKYFCNGWINGKPVGIDLRFWEILTLRDCTVLNNLRFNTDKDIDFERLCVWDKKT